MIKRIAGLLALTALLVACGSDDRTRVATTEEVASTTTTLDVSETNTGAAEAAVAQYQQAQADTFLREYAAKKPVERPVRASRSRSAPTTAPKRPKPVQTAPRASSGVWDRLAGCESTGNWHINTGNGYSGGLQMDRTFWITYDGPQFAPAPHLASREAQIVVAQRARDGYNGLVRGKRVWVPARGYSPWPACSRKLGLR